MTTLPTYFLVMAGLVPAIHVFLFAGNLKTWRPATRCAGAQRGEQTRA
jgi:hypothetical protein